MFSLQGGIVRHWHLFFECRFAHIMWRLSPIGFVPGMNGQASSLAWFDNSIDRWKGAEKGDHTLTLVTTIMWRIWKCRNELLFNRGEPDPKQMVIVAAEEFIQAMRQTEFDRGQQRIIRA